MAESAKDATTAIAKNEPAAADQPSGPGKGKGKGKGKNKGKASLCGGGKKLLDDYRRLYGNHLFRHLIVLTPDPVESGGSEPFEYIFEGVEEAVSGDESDGEAYVHDHQWFPWADAAAKASRCWEGNPGVAVYRRLDGPDWRRPPLMVLFVGETHTWGLRADQFEAAMSLIRDYGTMAGDTRSPYLVLGPTFSGTAASLSAVIRKRSIGGKHFRIVSGTATSVKAPQILTPTQWSSDAEHSDAEAPSACGRAAGRSGSVTYESATATDTCLVERMEEFLLERGGRCADDSDGGNIVLFTETSTTYGSAGTESMSHLREPDKSCFRRWKLPPDLASIRRSSEKVDDKASTSAKTSAERPPEPQGEGGTTRLSPTSVAVHELALSSTLDWMSDTKIRFAGIIATDPKDVIFLARRFRQQLPDIRLFTLGASIQYVDERAADALNGMLVVHSAPSDRTRSMSLRNEFVRKIYYAGRRLLADEPLESEPRVSFIGNGRLWRIDDDTRPPGPADPSRMRTLPSPASWQLTLALFSIVFIAGLVVVALGLPEWHRPRRGRFWSLVAPCTGVDLKRKDCAISAALITVCAGPVLVMLQSMIARPGQQPDPWHVLALASVMAVTGTSLLKLANLGAETAAMPHRQFLALLPVVASTVVVALALYVGWRTERRATFHLLSGGSPVLVGLIAMGSYALTLWCARARLRMLDTHRFQAVLGEKLTGVTPPIAQALGEKVEGRSGLADLERHLLGGLHDPWQHARGALLAVNGLLLLTLALPIYIKPPHTLEPGWRNVALVGLAVVASLTTSINLAWFLIAWIRFMRFLRRLASFPEVIALSRPSDRHRRPLEEQLAGSGSDATQLIYPVEMLRRLAELDRTQQESYADCRRFLEEELAAEAAETTGAVEAAEAAETRRKPLGRSRELVDKLLETSFRLPGSGFIVFEGTRARIDDFRASLIDLFIPRYVRHFRLFLPPMVLACMCSVFLASLYFVQPQRLIASVALFWAAVTVGVVLVSYVSLYVDPVVRAVAGSSHKGTSRFALVRKFAVWAAVPVAGYLAVDHAEFPLWVSRILDVVGKSLR